MTIAYPYQVITPPSVLPVTVAEFREQLRLPCLNQEDDDYLKNILAAATKFAEKYTHLTFIDTGYLTYRTGFTANCYSAECFELRKAPFSSLTSIQYLVADTLTIVASSVYYVTASNDYSSVFLKDGETWPTDADIRLQNIQIKFVAGYGASPDDVPEDIKMAIMQHGVAIYENRGDCDSASVTSSLPNYSKQVYDLNKIVSITGKSIC